MIHYLRKANLLRLPRLFEVAHGDGRFTKLMAGFAKTDLIILDDWGLAKFTVEQRRGRRGVRRVVRSSIVTGQTEDNGNRGMAGYVGRGAAVGAVGGALFDGITCASGKGAAGGPLFGEILASSEMRRANRCN